MRFGIHISPTAESADIRAVGRAAEERGFESLFLPEHTHIPISSQSLVPDDPDWLEGCKHMLDPFVSLGVVAAVTERLLLCTGVCLLPQHDPIVLAKTVATLDVLASGRVQLGIGAGWNEAEMRHHGVEPATRFRMMREKALAMKAMWTQDIAEFHGTFVDLDPLWLWPKPHQRPHPPLLIGGEGPHVLDRVLDYGDEWLPNDHPAVTDRIVELQRRAVEHGRDPIPVTINAVPKDPARIEALITVGVTRCVFNVNASSIGSAVDALDKLARLLEPYRRSA